MDEITLFESLDQHESDISVDEITLFESLDQPENDIPDGITLFESLDQPENDIPERYRIQKILGKGSYGTVYEVYDNEENRKVVVKKIQKQSLFDIEEVNVMKLLGDTCSNYFVCFYEYEETDEDIIIIMEWLDGYEPLSNYVDEFSSQLDDPTIKDKFCLLYTNICKGLQLLHSQNIAHEDIKPENIMVDADTMRIKIIDFGGACIENDCSRLPITYTLHYIDPLVLQNKDSKSLELFQQGDLWSFGITLYKLITGTVPYLYLSYKDIDEYSMNYDYKNDPNREKINEFLFTLGCNINLDNLLSLTEKRKYSCEQI